MSATFVVVVECDCCPAVPQTVEATSHYDAATQVRDRHIARFGLRAGRAVAVTSYTLEQARRAGVKS